jgi:hypothetical protein
MTEKEIKQEIENDGEETLYETSLGILPQPKPKLETMSDEEYEILSDIFAGKQ